MRVLGGVLYSSTISSIRKQGASQKAKRKSQKAEVTTEDSCPRACGERAEKFIVFRFARCVSHFALFFPCDTRGPYGFLTFGF
jgi:hypothetical protein